jgi:anti-sigma B factor antagonist
MSLEFFRIVEVRSATVVELSMPAHLDSGEFDRLNQALLEVFTQKPSGRWVMDLAGLAYMGSSVLGLMVNVRQRIKDGGGKLALCNMSDRLHRVFQTCSLERLFTIKSDRDEALKAVER